MTNSDPEVEFRNKLHDLIQYYESDVSEAAMRDALILAAECADTRRYPEGESLRERVPRHTRSYVRQTDIEFSFPEGRDGYK